MKMNKLVLPILGASVLMGCGSDSESTVPSVQERTVNVNAVLANVSEMNALNQKCLSDVAPVNTMEVTQFENNVCAILDVYGNVHYLRTSDYKLSVTDMYGTKNYDINDIVMDSIQTVEVFGEATFKITPKEENNSGNQYYSYYLVEGEEFIANNESSVTIAVDNKNFSYVTFSVKYRDEIDFDLTTITELRSETMNFGATGSTTVNGDNESDVEHDTYAYRYINKNADIIFTAYNGLTSTAVIDDFEAVKHYNFGELVIDPTSGEIIITPPDFGAPIIIEPTPVSPVISPSQMDNAEFKRFDENGYAIFSTTTNLKGEAEPWLYPEIKFEEGEKSLKQFNFNYEIDDNGADFSTFMNIYLLVGEETIRAEYYPNQKVIVEGITLTKSEFISTYGDYKLESRIDGIKFNTNFIVRVADTNTEEDLEFVVKTMTVEELTPAVTQNQLVGGTILDSISTDTHGVNIELTGNRDKDAVDNPLWVYNTNKFTADEATAPLLSQVSIDVDIEVSDDFSDKTASGAYVNIYLDGWSATETFSLLLTGTNKGKVIQRINREGEAQEVYDTYESFQSAYSEVKVLGLLEGVKPNTNFTLRFGDNDNSKGEAGNLLGEIVTINRFDVTISDMTGD